MFFPPDPSVATNVAFMIDELGLETTENMTSSFWRSQ